MTKTFRVETPDSKSLDPSSLKLLYNILLFQQHHLNFYRPQIKSGARQCIYTCVSLCSQGVSASGYWEVVGLWVWGCLRLGVGLCLWAQGSVCQKATEAGGTHPSGMHSCCY